MSMRQEHEEAEDRAIAARGELRDEIKSAGAQVLREYMRAENAYRARYRAKLARRELLRRGEPLTIGTR